MQAVSSLCNENQLQFQKDFRAGSQRRGSVVWRSAKGRSQSRAGIWHLKQGSTVKPMNERVGLCMIAICKVQLRSV
jgi:hypothetical protein